MQPSLQMVWFTWPPFITLFPIPPTLRGSPAEWGQTARHCKKSCPHSVFSYPRGSTGGQILPPTSLMMHGASLALTGAMLKSFSVCMPSRVAFEEHPCAHSFAQELLLWCECSLSFWPKCQSTQYSLRFFRPSPLEPQFIPCWT